jgi:hypothetical protein
MIGRADEGGEVRLGGLQKSRGDGEAGGDMGEVGTDRAIGRGSPYGVAGAAAVREERLDPASRDDGCRSAWAATCAAYSASGTATTRRPI